MTWDAPQANWSLGVNRASKRVAALERTSVDAGSNPAVSTIYNNFRNAVLISVMNKLEFDVRLAIIEAMNKMRFSEAPGDMAARSEAAWTMNTIARALNDAEAGYDRATALEALKMAQRLLDAGHEQARPYVEDARRLLKKMATRRMDVDIQLGRRGGVSVTEAASKPKHKGKSTAKEKSSAKKTLKSLGKKAKTFAGKARHMQWADDPNAALGALYAKAGKDPKKEGLSRPRRPRRGAGLGPLQATGGALRAKELDSLRLRRDALLADIDDLTGEVNATSGRMHGDIRHELEKQLRQREAVLARLDAQIANLEAELA